LTWPAALPVLSLACLTVHGCSIGTSGTIGGVNPQGAVRRPPSAPPHEGLSLPGATRPTQASASNQSGLINAAIQGIKGIEINQAMPLGVAVLLGFTNLSMMTLLGGITFLSHRREVLRLKRGGTGVAELRPQDPRTIVIRKRNIDQFTP